jgi:hypothetical protein
MAGDAITTLRSEYLPDAGSVERKKFPRLQSVFPGLQTPTASPHGGQAFATASGGIWLTVRYEGR